MKTSIAMLMMKSVLKGLNTPFLLGGTGIGKSAIVRALAEALADDRKLVEDKINPKENEFGFMNFRLSLYESHALSGLRFI